MRRSSFSNGFVSFSLWVGVLVFFCAPATVAHEEPEVPQEEEEPEVSPEEIERYEKAKKAARNKRIQEGVKENETGADPRSFALQWAPYYRYTELENGLIQQEMVAFGVVGFTPRLGMFYELPLAQHRDFSADPDFPGPNSKVIGMGDGNLKFLWRPEALEMTYGKEGKMSGSVLIGTEFILPTATDDALGGHAFVFSPILGVVFDMPLHGFVAFLNLYEFDVWTDGSLGSDTSRYVARIFYMQPLTPPGKWWGGLYLMPEVQPIYDFIANDFSIWIGPEFGKMFAPGRILYVKPGWGISNSEKTDRKFTVEVGFRWFF